MPLLDTVFAFFFAHLVGDYFLQSSWMALRKTHSSWAAGVHAATYGIPFLIFSPTLAAWSFIVVTHFFIDRFQLAKYLVYAQSYLGPASWRRPWADCRVTGHLREELGGPPMWMARWLYIIVDNSAHLALNFVALAYID
mgnify:CR=1 FL=1